MKTRFGGVLLATIVGGLCAGCGGSPDAKTAAAASETAPADSAAGTADTATVESEGEAAGAEADDGWADDTSGAADESSTDEEADGWAEPAAASGAASDGADSRTTETIMEFVKANRQPVRDCVNAEQRKDPTLGGDLVLKFVLTPSGKVTRLSVNETETTFQSETATSCILGVVRGWTFPPSSKGKEMVVNYPFTFNARKK